MNKQNYTKQMVSLLIFLILSSCMPDQIKESPTGLNDYPDTGYYKINPETILQSLNQGNPNVFTPLIATPEVYEPLYSASSSWKQSDYLKIAGALFQYVWKETPDDWDVYDLEFHRNCQDISIGFDGVQITFFKAVEPRQYTTRQVSIAPLYGEVDSGGGANFPRPLMGWKSINLKALKVTADNALQTAESNGGKEARSAIKNACRIFISLMPSSPSGGWDTLYLDENAKTIFEMTIDPYTGLYLPP